MGTFTGLSINIGVFSASAIGLPQLFGTSTLWYYAYFIEIIPCLLLLAYAAVFLQESPMYYLQRGDENGALHSIKYYYRSSQIERDIVKNLRDEIEASNAIKHARWTLRERYMIEILKKVEFSIWKSKLGLESGLITQF